MKRATVCLPLILFGLLLMSACQKGPETPVSMASTESFVAKPVDGTAPLFDEGLSFYNTNPSIFDVSETERYVYYTVNETAKGIDSAIAVRKAVKENGVWNYGPKKIILRKGSGWDQARVGACDVIKGQFAFGGKAYSYLMAYQGNATAAELNQGIGFAVGETPDGDFVKVTAEKAAIAYDPSAYGGISWGIGQPSLLSYDQAGKVFLFYTLGEPQSTQTYVQELDCSDLGAIKGLATATMVPTRGLKETENVVALCDADFALDSTGQTLYCVRNVNPVSATAPTTYTAVQVSKMPLSGLYQASAEWSIVEEKINLLDLGTDQLGGWERVYSGCLIANPFGRFDRLPFEVGLTVTSWDAISHDYLYYQTLTTFQMTVQ